MPWNGAGTFNLDPSYSPEVNGTIIDATRYNGLTTDIANGITAALAKNGENAATNDIPMGSHKFTGLSAGTVAGDSVRYEQALNVDNLSIASAATVNLVGVLQTDLTLTGTTTITSFGTGATAGVRKWLTVATGAGPIALTHSATLVCPGAVNLSVSAGETISVRAEAANVWRVDKLPLYAFSIPDGTVSAPGLYFSSDVDNGLYRIGTNNWAMSVGGSKILEFSTTRATVSKGFTAASAATSGSVTPSDAHVISTGATTGSSSTSGTITVTTGNASAAGTGAITIQTGSATTGASFPSGALSLLTGNVYGGSAGPISLIAGGNDGTGGAGDGTGIQLYLTRYDSTGADGGGEISLNLGSRGSSTNVPFARVFNNRKVWEWSTSPGAPSIVSGGGTGATVVGTAHGFIFTAGTTASTTVVIQLPTADTNADAMIATANSSNTGYVVGTTTVPASRRVSLVFSVAPSNGDTIHCHVSYYSAF